MYVLASKGKWSQPFFREELATNDEPLATNDKPMDPKLSQPGPAKPLALPGKSKQSEEIKHTKKKEDMAQRIKEVKGQIKSIYH